MTVIILYSFIFINNNNNNNKILLYIYIKTLIYYIMYEYLLKRYFILIKNPFIKLDYLFIYIYNKIKLLL
jgi:hypothetical protein